MTYNLKACPFCGGRARLVKKTNGYTTNPVTIRNEWIVKCDNCALNVGPFDSEIYENDNGELIIDKSGPLSEQQLQRQLLLFTSRMRGDNREYQRKVDKRRGY